MNAWALMRFVGHCGELRGIYGSSDMGKEAFRSIGEWSAPTEDDWFTAPDLLNPEAHWELSLWPVVEP